MKEQPKTSDEQTCFVIGPIGDPDSPTRQNADMLLNYIIKPAAEACGFDVLRADKISSPGLITSQIIQHLVQDRLVIADLTGNNANVFYELAVRHVVKKPVVQLIPSGQNLPFDVKGHRTIQFGLDVAAATQATDEIKKQIEAAMRDPTQADNPISAAMVQLQFSQSDKPVEELTANIFQMFQDLRGDFRDLREQVMSLTRGEEVMSLKRGVGKGRSDAISALANAIAEYERGQSDARRFNLRSEGPDDETSGMVGSGPPIGD